MGRKTIPPNQRAQPISFSLKPHLIEKIDDYAHDLRFSRSKFLMQAVTEYMTRHIVHGLESSSNVDDMSIDRRVAVGLAALQEANREGHLIKKGVMDALRREINPQPAQVPIEETLETAGLRDLVSPQSKITSELYIAGEHLVKANSTVIGKVVKQGKRWRAIGINSPAFQIMHGDTLKEVMQVITEAVKDEEVYF
jgi:hypothetical protein